MKNRKSKRSLDKQKLFNSQKAVSLALYSAFRPTKWLLLLCSRFPFTFREQVDGTMAMEFHATSWNAIAAYVSAFISTIFFSFCFVGTVAGIFFPHWPVNRPVDRCNQTWEQAIMKRQFVLIVFSLTQMFMAMVGSWYMIWNAKTFVHYYNFWNSGLMDGNFDATVGTRRLTYRTHAILLFIVVLYCVVFLSGGVQPVQDSAGFVIQTALYFFVPNLYATGSSEGPLTYNKFKNFAAACCDCTNCHKKVNYEEAFCTKSCWNTINNPSIQYFSFKGLGFLIELHAMLGTRCLMIQFEFFCCILANFCRGWNKRLSNTFSYKKSDKIENNSIPERRRLDFESLTYDHATIFHLFSLTSDTFGFILVVYYGFMCVNITCQFYFILGMLPTQYTCAEVTQLEIDYVDRNGDRCFNVDAMKEYRQHGENSLVSFEDPCINLSSHRTETIWISLFVFVCTVYLFVTSVHQAAAASDQAYVGFTRMRKHGYISCRTSDERNFIHTLIFSFGGPRPFLISAWGYFTLRRQVILIALSSCLIFFLIILGFKPGMTYPMIRCEDQNRNLKIAYSDFIW